MVNEGLAYALDWRAAPALPAASDRAIFNARLFSANS